MYVFVDGYIRALRNEVGSLQAKAVPSVSLSIAQPTAPAAVSSVLFTEVAWWLRVPIIPARTPIQWDTLPFLDHWAVLCLVRFNSYCLVRWVTR